jgi:ribosomal RNA-processing protein 8
LTNAQYKQLIGRLHRLGQQKDFVDIHIIMATMAGYEYDRHKWTRLEFKRTLADCAIDGKMPEGKLQTKEQMQLELIRWLERLERNEISIFERRKLSIELTPSQRVEHERKISEFSRLNNVWNRSYSNTIHDRITQDPQYLVEYHAKLQDIRSRWLIDPVNVIAEKINSLKIPANVIMKLVIGDFGCGRCELSELLKENKVYCFDHHKILNEKIIACNMKDTGLKADKLDVAVFCLSLMGYDWPEYIKEARRCLAKNGYLVIGQTSRELNEGERLHSLRDIIGKEGFEIYSEEQRGDFTFIEARKL